MLDLVRGFKAMMVFRALDILLKGKKSTLLTRAGESLYILELNTLQSDLIIHISPSPGSHFSLL